MAVPAGSKPARAALGDVTVHGEESRPVGNGLCSESSPELPLVLCQKDLAGSP